jgi:hypothetical protein
MLAEMPDLLNAAYAWNENAHETAIQGAAQVGSIPVAKHLLEKGAPLEICTAAMLGLKEDVEERIKENPRHINSKGAHGIPILPHAAWSGNLEPFNTYSEMELELDHLWRFKTQLREVTTTWSSGSLRTQALI